MTWNRKSDGKRSLLVAFRVGPEERMMREQLGDAWTDYASRTRRLVPGV